MMVRMSQLEPWRMYEGPRQFGATFGLYTGRALGAPWIGMAIGRVWYLAVVRAFRTNLLYFK